jgi:hypothetical protein
MVINTNVLTTELVKTQGTTTEVLTAELVKTMVINTKGSDYRAGKNHED